MRWFSDRGHRRVDRDDLPSIMLLRAQPIGNRAIYIYIYTVWLNGLFLARNFARDRIERRPRALPPPDCAAEMNCCFSSRLCASSAAAVAVAAAIQRNIRRVMRSKRARLYRGERICTASISTISIPRTWQRRDAAALLRRRFFATETAVIRRRDARSIYTDTVDYALH